MCLSSFYTGWGRGGTEDREVKLFNQSDAALSGVDRWNFQALVSRVHFTYALFCIAPHSDD